MFDEHAGGWLGRRVPLFVGKGSEEPSWNKQQDHKSLLGDCSAGPSAFVVSANVGLISN
jgi:hypothetical protein